MWSYLQDLNKSDGTTIFFTTHYMEEADRLAQRIAVIDHGKIIASGTSADLKKKTKKATLEEAFLELTGKTIRDESAGTLDHMRNNRRMWRR
jgi:ABC-2 type transport system ATP-binding protein